MKILHCLAQLPSMTGSGIYYSVLVEGLAKRGHENALIYAVDQERKADFSKEILQYPVEFSSREIAFPIAGMSDEMPYPSTVYSSMSKEQTELWMRAFQERLWKAREEFDPDLIISHHLFMLTALVRRCFPDKKVLGIGHGTDVRQIKKHGYFREKYMEGIEAVDACFAIAPKDIVDIEKLIGIPREKIEVMGGGFNQEVFYANASSEAKAESFSGKTKRIELLYAGKIAYAKGVYELVKALPKIEERDAKIRLSLVGNANSSQKERLREYAGHSKNLEFVPALPQHELAEKMRNSDLFILPSYYEGLGLVNIEALACGCRVVSTAIEGLIWLLSGEINASGLIEYVELPRLMEVDKPYEEDKPAFVEALKEKILLQIGRIRAGEEPSRELRRKIDEHSWKGIVEKTEACLKRLLREGRRD